MPKLIHLIYIYASGNTDQPNNINMTSTKALAESPGFTSLPLSHIFPHGDHISSGHSIPTIDFSLLTSTDPHQRSKAVLDLGRACQDWGFFLVTNHGVPEALIEAMLDASRAFFDMPEEEKKELDAKNVLDPIRAGSSFNPSVEQVSFWRDFLKIIVHPHFHSPVKPNGFREVSLEYSKKTREVARELLKGISESLGLEDCYIDKSMSLDSCFQHLIINLYPSCPQPELAMGMPPHSDHGLLTLLVQNGVGGLQLQHNGQWVDVGDIQPNSFLVNTADHLEILSNGQYKSVVHRAVVNNRAARISIALSHGPSHETVVRPAPPLVDDEANPPAYVGIPYKDYWSLQQNNKLDGKSCLDRVRV